MFKILYRYFKYHKHWDSLCHQCGKCCYIRYRRPNGQVVVCTHEPCEYLDQEHKTCTVYEDRFTMCDHCGKLHFWTALFDPLLPEDCGYVQTFRLWKRK